MVLLLALSELLDVPGTSVARQVQLGPMHRLGWGAQRGQFAVNKLRISTNDMVK